MRLGLRLRLGLGLELELGLWLGLGLGLLIRLKNSFSKKYIDRHQKVDNLNLFLIDITCRHPILIKYEIRNSIKIF